MKLVYWVAENRYDSKAYNIRERRKKDAVAKRNLNPDRYGPVTKVEVEYLDAFDLVDMALSEVGIEH